MAPIRRNPSLGIALSMFHALFLLLFFPLSPSLLSSGDLLDDDPFFFPSKGERVLWASALIDVSNLVTLRDS